MNNHTNEGLECEVTYSQSFLREELPLSMDSLRQEFETDCEEVHKLLVFFRDGYALENRRFYLIEKFNKILELYHEGKSRQGAENKHLGQSEGMEI